MTALINFEQGTHLNLKERVFNPFTTTEVPYRRVKSVGVRQSKIGKVGLGRERVNLSPKSDQHQFFSF